MPTYQYRCGHCGTEVDKTRPMPAIGQHMHAHPNADQGASPVLVAVMNEFAKKAEKATHSDDERAAVIELEQAGDSAKVAAEADTGLADATCQAILDAHLAICIAKAKL